MPLDIVRGYRAMLGSRGITLRTPIIFGDHRAGADVDDAQAPGERYRRVRREIREIFVYIFSTSGRPSARRRARGYLGWHRQRQRILAVGLR